jgi:hypothetical protein
VRAFRQLFQNEMGDKLIGTVEKLTGRKVLTYQSQVLFDPHIVIEMFVFEDSGGRAAALAAAEGQFDEDGNGIATSQ